MNDSRAALRTPEVIRLAAGREIRQRLRAKSFYLFTGLLVVVILGFGVASRLIGDDGPGVLDVGTPEPAAAELAAVLGPTAEAVDRDADVTPFPDASAARAALDDGRIDVAVLPAENAIVFADDVEDEAVVVLQQAWSSLEISRALADAGLTPEQAGAALTTTPLEVVTLDGDGGTSGLAVLTGTLAAILLFIALQTFGGYVLTGVVEEKATAVVEVLLVRARADQLLAGKVIGIGVAAMLQLTCAVVAGLASLAISGVAVPGEIWSALPMTLVWFLGGYALYSTLFALAGSLVSRQEDAQAASAPIISVLLGAYMLIFVFGYAPDSTASVVLSLIPPIAPLLMPMRMAAGAASAVEVVVALVLLAAAVWAAWKLAGRVYEQVLLRRGSRISWRDAVAIARGA